MLLALNGYSRQKTNQKWAVEEILLWKKPWNFLIFYFNAGNSRKKTKLHPLKFHKIVLHKLASYLKLHLATLLLKTPKSKILGNTTRRLFLEHHGNSTSLLVKSWIFWTLILPYPWKFHIFITPVNCLVFCRLDCWRVL